MNHFARKLYGRKLKQFLHTLSSLLSENTFLVFEWVLCPPFGRTSKLYLYQNHLLERVKFTPIAITPPFMKTMQKLLLLSLVSSLKSFNDPKQFASKHSRSILDASTVLYHSVVSSLDKGGKFVCCALLDYTSAFNSVPWDILLDKLSVSQTECRVVNWLHSYFSGKKQQEVFHFIAY